MKTQVQEIEEELLELAEATKHATNKLKELRESFKRRPQDGDVWESHGECYIIDENLHGVSPNGFRTGRTFASYESFECNEDAYLGKFNEVYMLKSQEDDSLKEIRDWRDSNGCGMDDVQSNDIECADFLYHFLNGYMDEYEPVKPPIC